MELGLNKQQYSLFQREAMYGSISVGGVCKNNCIFCSTLVSKKCMRQPPFHNYISWEDFNSVLPIINWAAQHYELEEDRNEIQIGNGIGILTCEPFYHPEYIEFIKALHKYDPSWWLFTGTVGKWIKPEWFDVFKDNNMHFFTSVNSLDKDMRSEIMHSEDDYDGLLLYLKECQDIIYKLSFVYHGNLDVFKKDLDKLLEISPKFIDRPIRFFLPEYSDYSSPKAKELYHRAIQTWDEANIHLASVFKYPQPAVTKIDEGAFPQSIYPSVITHRENFDERMRHILSIFQQKNIDLDDVGFLLAESVYDYAEKYDINRIFTKNITTGGSYKVAGLLSRKDILSAIESTRKYKYYVLSRDVFRYFDIDLVGYHPREYGDYHFILS